MKTNYTKRMLLGLLFLLSASITFAQTILPLREKADGSEGTPLTTTLNKENLGLGGSDMGDGTVSFYASVDGAMGTVDVAYTSSGYTSEKNLGDGVEAHYVLTTGDLGNGLGTISFTAPNGIENLTFTYVLDPNGSIMGGNFIYFQHPTLYINGTEITYTKDETSGIKDVENVEINQEGEVTVKLEAIGGSDGSSYVDVIAVASVSWSNSSLGIKEKYIVANVYPNPVKEDGILHISQNMVSAKFYNVAGSLVRDINVTGKTINLSGLNKGLYFMVAKDINNTTLHRKIVIE
ncbi:MAG: T9SS type A sorting domain-containing protein [Bacteroidota bacterium]